MLCRNILPSVTFRTSTEDWWLLNNLMEVTDSPYSVGDGLTNGEIQRYGRQLILPEFGVQGQRLLKSQSALVVGCGGLGCPAAIYLSAAGIGTLGLLDHDDVEISNLHRQILHKENNTGTSKCSSAKAACESLNSLPIYRLHKLAINSSNALSIIKEYEVVLDCTDNVATRYLLNDACVLAKKPLVSGAALKFEGQLTVYNYNEGPCYRCLYPKPPPAHAVTSCSEGGVMGVIPGIIGAMQAQEAIKVLTSMPGSLSGRLFIYDGLRFTTHVIKLRGRQSTCAVCGDNPSVTKPVDYLEFCGVVAADDNAAAGDVQESTHGRVTVRQYKSDYMNKTNHILVDTRPSHETDICRFSQSINIPLNELTTLSPTELVQALQLQKSAQPIVCICHHGNDSQVAAQHITKHIKSTGLSPAVVDVVGGLDAWARLVDSSFPRY